MNENIYAKIYPYEAMDLHGNDSYILGMINKLSRIWFVLFLPIHDGIDN